MKLTYFIYLQLTIRWLIKHFTVIYRDANKQFLTLNLNIFCREKISLSGTPISLPKIADLPIWAQENITCMFIAKKSITLLQNRQMLCTGPLLFAIWLMGYIIWITRQCTLISLLFTGFLKNSTPKPLPELYLNRKLTSWNTTYMKSLDQRHKTIRIIFHLVYFLFRAASQILEIWYLVDFNIN